MKFTSAASCLLSLSILFTPTLHAQAPPASAPAAAAAAAAAANASAVPQEQLETSLAPIALYPDALLSQMLMASTYPLEVVEAARWRKANASLKDKALDPDPSWSKVK